MELFRGTRLHIQVIYVHVTRVGRSTMNSAVKGRKRSNGARVVQATGKTRPYI